MPRKKLVENLRPNAEVRLPKTGYRFDQVNQASFGGPVENGKRSEHRDLSALRLPIRFSFINDDRGVELLG